MTAYGWAELEQEAPELAAAVRACFAVRKHCTMATLRADGSPRISGTEVQWEDGALWVGSMPGARKARDLQRDGRVAVHSPTVDPPAGDESSWAGEAKVAGIAVEVGVEVGAATGAATGHPPDSHRFRIDLTEVVHTRVEGDALLITSWHPGRGVQERRRK
jgi:hypothetical protein